MSLHTLYFYPDILKGVDFAAFFPYDFNQVIKLKPGCISEPYSYSFY